MILRRLGLAGVQTVRSGLQALRPRSQRLTLGEQRGFAGCGFSFPSGVLGVGCLGLGENFSVPRFTIVESDQPFSGNTGFFGALVCSS